MSSDQDQLLVPGIWINASGEVTVAPELDSVLCDIAMELEEDADLPVDVEHVVAAIVLGVQNGEIDEACRISAHDDAFRAILAHHVRVIFEQYNGMFDDDDDADIDLDD